MGSASSTTLQQPHNNHQRDNGNDNDNDNNQNITNTNNQHIHIDNNEPVSPSPSFSSALTSFPTELPNIMTTPINEESAVPDESENHPPISSPGNSANQPIDLMESPLLTVPRTNAYQMERSETLNTVTQSSNNNKVNVDVVVHSENNEPTILNQQSMMSNDNVSPPPSQQEAAVPAAASASAGPSATGTGTGTAERNSNTRPSTANPSYNYSRSNSNNHPNSTSKKIKSRSKMGVKHDTINPTDHHNNSAFAMPCLNPPSEVNARLDTQVEVRVYPCNNSNSERKKKFTQFMVKPEGVIIQGTNKNRTANNDLGAEYANHIGRKLQRYELSDTRACQLLVTTHAKSYWVVPAPEAFSRHSGTCRLLGDRKHAVANHTLQVGDFLRVGSVGVVVIETHNGQENRILSEEKIQKIMKDTTNSNGGFMDDGETDGENSDDSMSQSVSKPSTGDEPVCYMCFDDENTVENPLITPCKCRGDTRYVHVGCLRKWHTAEADNQICFLSSVDATCSVCKSTFKSDFKLKDGRLMKLFKSSLEPPYISLLVATKHEMAQRLFNTRFQLSFSTIMKPDGRNASRPLLLGRSSGSDMVLDYRTVSARHATIRFKNNEFIFTDAQSSNGSYLYLRRPVELSPNQQVQFRLGRSMISMKVVNKWNKRLLRAVRRSGNNSANSNLSAGAGDDHSVGSNEEDVRISDGKSGTFTSYLPRRSRESIVQAMPAPGKLRQTSSQHLDLLYALAYPKKSVEGRSGTKKNSVEESKVEEEKNVTNMMTAMSIADAQNK